VSYEEFLVALGLAHSECAQVAFHAFDTEFQDRFDLRQAGSLASVAVLM